MGDRKFDGFYLLSILHILDNFGGRTFDGLFSVLDILDNCGDRPFDAFLSVLRKKKFVWTIGF